MRVITDAASRKAGAAAGDVAARPGGASGRSCHDRARARAGASAAHRARVARSRRSFSRRDRLRPHARPRRSPLALAARLRDRHPREARRSSRRFSTSAPRRVSALFMDVAQYAAVGETVELAPKRARGFVNAILRRISTGDAPEPRDLATRTAHPQWLIERWTQTTAPSALRRSPRRIRELSYPDVLAMGDELPPGAGGPRPAAGGEAEGKGSWDSSAGRGCWPPVSRRRALNTRGSHLQLRGSSADLDRRKFWPTG